MVRESWEPSPRKHGLFISLVSLFMGFKSSLNWNISVETIRHVLQRKGCNRLVHLCCAINGLCHKCTRQSINGLGSLYCAQLWPQGSYGLPNCTLSYFSQPPACCAPVSRFICLMQGIRCCMQGSSWQFFFCMCRNTVAHSRFPTCKGVADSKFIYKGRRHMWCKFLLP